MRFKIDKNLERVWAEIPSAPMPDEKEFSTALARALISVGLLDPDGDIYGRKVSDAMGEIPVAKVAAFVSGFLGLNPIPADVFGAFCNLIVMGDGECPVCGGTLVYDETEGHELNDGDYYTPNSWVPDLYCYHCANCGEIYKTPTEL